MGEAKGGAEYTLRYAAGVWYLVFPDSEPYRPPLSMNESAHFIFERYIKGTGAGDIARELAAEYGIDADGVRPDVDGFIDRLAASGITAEA